MTLATMTPTEASIFACLADTVLTPRPLLPPVAETDTAAFFDLWMGRSPRFNRIAVRALLYVIEVAPLFMGFGRRMRRLDDAERARYLHSLERAHNPQLRQLVKLFKGFAALSYYGDDRVMLRIGYDAEANLRRGRELRAAEGRL
jgi:hypothetical protein